MSTTEKKETKMLTHEEVTMLAAKVNAEINLPFLGEAAEFKLFYKYIDWIDSWLYGILPNEYYSMLKSSLDGISVAEAAYIKKVVANKLNYAIDIPYVPEIVEAKLFAIVVDMIVDAMVKGFNIEEVSKIQ